MNMDYILKGNYNFDDVLEKALRASNEIKVFLSADDFDGCMNFLVTYLDGFINFNNRVYYKLLKMKFIHLMLTARQDQAVDLYKEQIEIFIRESFSFNEFTRIQSFFYGVLQKETNISTELLNIEKTSLTTKIFKHILLYIALHNMRSNPECCINQKQVYDYLEREASRYYIDCHDYTSDIDSNVYNHSNNLPSNNANTYHKERKASNADNFKISSSSQAQPKIQSDVNYNNQNACYNQVNSINNHNLKSHSGNVFSVSSYNNLSGNMGSFSAKLKSPAKMNDSLSNKFITDKSSLYNQMNGIKLNNSNKINSASSINGRSTHSKFSAYTEFTKTFKPNFEKKEAIDKKILRRFRNYLIDLHKKKQLDLSDADKNFWGIFVQDNFLPPMKYNNPDTGEFVEYKSFCNDFIFWLFSRKGAFNLYESFKNIIGSELFESFVKQSQKLSDNQKEKELLMNYINTFHVIYSGESPNDKPFNDKDIYMNYFGKSSLIF